MHNIVSHIVLASADKNLGAGDGVRAVCLRLCLGAQQAEIGAALRLRQAHGAGPLSGNEFGQILRFLLNVTVRCNGVDRSMA